MELVKALAPPVAALIALIAVIVNLYNTGRQIKANASNLEKQLKANAENLQRQLDVGAENLQKQLESQAREADKNRKAQLDQILRAERRQILTRAAEVVHRLRDTMTILDKAHFESRYIGFDDGEKLAAYKANVSAITQQLNAAGLEAHFVATNLEILDLTELAGRTRYYRGLVISHADYGRELDPGIADDLLSEARIVLDALADALRS
ncbi:hypothetical protein [Mycobacteroides abscessus]|uniref:hypothetical protein n=1 Tax=Mycobacteroides abscessus TaxID=36809 RepID=UPI002103523B|nr:hypothetical protein [Mycobacteroides abscessus]